MKTFIFTNEKNNERYTRTLKDSSTARHWVINHLDLSKNWSIKTTDEE